MMTTDHELDEIDLHIHATSANIGFLIATTLLGLAVVILAVMGWVAASAVLAAAVFFLRDARLHRDARNVLAARLEVVEPR